MGVKSNTSQTAQLCQDSAQNALWMDAVPNRNCLLQLHPITELAEFKYCSMSIIDVKRNYVSQYWWVNTLLFLEITNLNNHVQNSTCLENLEYFQEASFIVDPYWWNPWKKTSDMVTGAFVCFQTIF